MIIQNFSYLPVCFLLNPSSLHNACDLKLLHKNTKNLYLGAEVNGKCKALREGETRGFSLRARNILASFLDCGTEPGDGSRDTDTTKVF